MAQEQVEQGSCADSGIFVRRVGGGGGGGGGEGGIDARRPENSLDNVFLVINFFNSLQSYYRGEEGVQLLPGGGGIQRNRYNL